MMSVSAFRMGAIRSGVAPVLRQTITRVPKNLSRVGARNYSSGTGYGSAPGMSSQQLLLRGAIGGGAAIGVLGLCYLGQQAGENASSWNDFVADRIHSTYGYFAGGLAMTAGVAYGLFQSPTYLRTVYKHPIAFSIGGFVVTMGAMMATRSIPQENKALKLATWSVFNTAIASTLAPLGVLGGPLLLQAATYTAAVVGGLSLVGMSARSDQFLSWGQPLAIGLGVIVVTSLGSVFLPARFLVARTVMDKVVVYGGMVVFSGLVLYDTQAIIQKAKYQRHFDPVNESMHIYLDTINLFRIIATQLAGSRRK